MFCFFFLLGQRLDFPIEFIKRLRLVQRRITAWFLGARRSRILFMYMKLQCAVIKISASVFQECIWKMKFSERRRRTDLAREIYTIVDLVPRAKALRLSTLMAYVTGRIGYSLKPIS